MSLENIFKRLNMTSENGLYITKDNHWKGELPKRLEFLIETKLEPTAFFCFDKKPLILFYDSPSNREKLFKDVWNFNETPVVIVNEPDAIEIYNGFSYLKDELTLEKLVDEDKIDDFSFFDLVSGKSLELYQAKLKQQNRVDFHLLRNIRDARNILIKEYKINDSLANALIGQCIFVRYLIDREVKIKLNGQLKKWKNHEFCNIFDDKLKLIEFLIYLKSHFNGEAFLLDENKLKDIPDKAFSVLKHLLMGTELSSGQQSLFDIYDFSIIPVEFISNVYEHFIGKENQAEKGVYYTPKFLVDYILAETVEKYFKENQNNKGCKVLDPACGSGIFLVEALRRIIEHNNITPETKDFKNILKSLAEDNIFGIDQDEEAVNVAIFSIYLALLDYVKDPKDIETFKFPNLKQNGNFFDKDFFDENAVYNAHFSDIEFDFIIGNPPWKRGASNDESFMQYIKKRAIKERKQKESVNNDNKAVINISNNEIAQAFLLRTSDFSSEKTKCALIVTSKTLYNLKAKTFRLYFLQNYFIDNVLELAPVRREVFDKSNDKAIAPAAILFFRYSHSKNTEPNELVHLCLKPNRLFSLLKIFVFQGTDIKKVVQKRLIDNDWLWKVLVYGSYLDFNLLTRIKQSYKTIADIIDNDNKFLIKQGLKRKDGSKDINVEKLFNWSFLNTMKKELKPFFIVPKHDTWKETKVGYIFKDENKNYTNLFTPPALLIKDGLTNDFHTVTALSLEKVVFTDSVTAIKPINQDSTKELFTIEGILNSTFCQYITLQTASFVGIERERSHDEEKFAFPFVDNSKIAKIVEQIEAICKHVYEESQKIFNPKDHKLEAKKQELIGQLNEEVFNSFGLDEQEFALVDYAINITIPLIMRNKGYEQNLFSSIDFNDNLLEEYIKIFLSRFESSFREKYLKAEIWHTNNILGIFFKVVPNDGIEQPVIEWQKKKNEGILKKIASLGVEKITENLFIQKYIRGFEKKGFYIIKPNEKKLWHKAIAYLDVEEFMDAILKAGKDIYNG